jgi:hypothetical protein
MTLPVLGTTLRVAVVAPILARHDAISRAAIHTWKMLADLSGVHASILTSHNEFLDVPAQCVPGVAEVLCQSTFLSADLLIYHFGIYHPLLDSVLIGNGRAKQIVAFTTLLQYSF